MREFRTKLPCEFNQIGIQVSKVSVKKHLKPFLKVNDRGDHNVSKYVIRTSNTLFINMCGLNIDITYVKSLGKSSPRIVRNLINSLGDLKSRGKVSSNFTKLN